MQVAEAGLDGMQVFGGSQEPRAGGEAELMPSPTWADRAPALPPELQVLEVPVWSS